MAQADPVAAPAAPADPAAPVAPAAPAAPAKTKEEIEADIKKIGAEVDAKKKVDELKTPKEKKAEEKAEKKAEDAKQEKAEAKLNSEI